MNILIENNNNWRNYCFSFLNNIPLLILKKIKLEYGNLKDCFKKEKSVIHFISDIINHRFMKAKPESKKFNNHTLKIYF